MLLLWANQLSHAIENVAWVIHRQVTDYIFNKGDKPSKGPHHDEPMRSEGTLTALQCSHLFAYLHQRLYLSKC